MFVCVCVCVCAHCNMLYVIMQPEMKEIFGKIFATKTQDEWTETFKSWQRMMIKISIFCKININVKCNSIVYVLCFGCIQIWMHVWNLFYQWMKHLNTLITGNYAEAFK